VLRRDSALALAAVAGATALCFALYGVLPLANLSLVYLIAVLWVALQRGLWPSVLAAVAAGGAYNFFFTKPRFSLDIHDPGDALSVVFFLVAAAIASPLAARVRAQADIIAANARRTANLYAFTRAAAAAGDLDGVLALAASHAARTWNGRAALLLPGRAGLEPAVLVPADSPPPPRPAWDGRPGDPAADPAWRYQPLRTPAGGALGVLAVRPGDTAPEPEADPLLASLADQMAAAIERMRLLEDVERARLAHEKERLRAALLAALSHDLRTPLVSILGAASSLVAYGGALGAGPRRELAETIQDEAERLNRFVQNLLDMTRLGAGALVPRTDWVDLADIVAGAVERARPLLAGRPVQLALAPDLPLLRLDAVLMQQVLFNLLDNAVKYAPEGPVRVCAAREGERVRVAVEDQGPGIAEADRERVFDMFSRAAAGDHRPAGTGLGLTICRGIVEAHGGTLVAEAGPGGRGAALVMRLPVAQ
jgi:two-component system sensor histidine kinase KdpD